MSRHTSARKREAERRDPHRVDVPVPPGGLGNRINLMNDWCRANFHADQWPHHGHSQKEPGQIAKDYARFYFLTEADANLFRWKWVTQ